MAQAVVVRFRPLKFITCLCGIIAFVLIIIALAGVWLTTKDGEVSDSLWESCETPNPCKDPASTDWLNAVRSFAILSLLLCLAATVIRFLGWFKGDKNIRWARIVAMVLMSAAMLSIIISLIIFPVMTLKTLPYRVRGTWQFHWAYGVAWGSVVFMVGFVVLLIIPGNVDHEEDKTQKNKIYYVNSGGHFDSNA